MTNEDIDSPILLGSESAYDEPVAQPEPIADAPVHEPEAPAVATPEAAPEAPKSDWVQKRFDKLTQQRYEAEAKAEQYRRELEASRAAPAGDPPVDGGTKVYTQDDVRVEAQRIAAAEAFNTRCNAVFDEGVRSHGDKFDAAIRNLNMAGVTQDTAFLNVALETDNPADVLNFLGQNPDDALRIAALTPVKQAIELQRLSAKIAATPKAAPKPLSNAPAPIAPVNGDRPKDTIDLYDDNTSEADWFREMERRDKAKFG